jgi:hypothetical protein
MAIPQPLPPPSLSQTTPVQSSAKEIDYDDLFCTH